MDDAWLRLYLLNATARCGELMPDRMPSVGVDLFGLRGTATLRGAIARFVMSGEKTERTVSDPLIERLT
jgi:hypothetical protein